MPDLLIAVRSLRKSAGFTTVAVLALGLGIGANTAIFSGVRALLLGPMPYSHPDRLVAVWEEASKIGFPRNTPAPGNFADWRRMNQVFTDMAALRYGGANLTGGDRPEFVLGRGVTANFFDVLGAHPIAGRTFTEQEDSTGAKLVVIGYALAQRRFGGTRGAIGATLLMNDQPYTVIGVMPPGFAFPDRQFEYWQPAHFSAADLTNRQYHYLNVVARLKPGVTAAQAQADMTTVARDLERQHADSNRSLGAVVVPLRDQLVGETGTELLVLMIAAGVVLFIACGNIANLLLIRGAERRRELAVRAALGASRPQIVRQLIVESLVLAMAGTALGLAIAGAGMTGLDKLIPVTLVNASSLKTDWAVLGFAIAVSLGSCLFFGLLPALRSSRLDLNDALKQGGRTFTEASGRLRQGFVVAQVSLALVLLTGAGMLIQTLAGLRSRDLGFAVDHLLTMLTPLSPKTYNTDPKTMAFADRVVEQVLHIPGVRAAGFASDLPFTSIGDTSGFQIEGRAPSPEDQFNDALYREVSSSYMAALSPQVIAGRLLDERDTADSETVVVINETFARRYWPNRSPIGEHMRVGGPKSKVRTIVGVIRDVRERGIQLDLKPAMYLAFPQVERPGATYLLVRTSVDPEGLSNAVQAAIRSVDKEQPVAAVRTMEEYAAREMAGRDGQFRILEVFAGLALFLAALGIYGVLAYSVAQRRREIGIRRAFGADTVSVAGLVLRQGLQLTAVGLAAGTLLAWAATRAMSSLLTGTWPLNVAAIAAAGAILAMAAMVACLAPSMAASRVEPASILREE
jgi:putative ABC transport system permease protein